MTDTTVKKIHSQDSPRALHTYRVLEGPFRAVEATSPPAEFHGRDDAP